MMALKACNDCGGKISAKAKSCPHCGAPLPKKTAITTWLAGGLFALIVGSCVANNAKNQSAAESARDAQRAIEASKSAEQKQAEAAEKARKDREVNLVLAGAKLLKDNMKKPEAFELTSAIMIDGKTVCYEYTSRNSFNDRVHEIYVFSLTDKSSGNDPKTWNMRCAGKSGTDYSYVRSML